MKTEEQNAGAKIYEALANFQGEMEVVEMDAKNPHFRSKYATLGNIIKTAKPHLHKNGLAVIQSPVKIEKEWYLKTLLTHKSGEYIVLNAPFPEEALSMRKGVSAVQVLGSVITYMRRYCYSSILGIYADEDTDGNTPQTASVTHHYEEKKPKTLSESLDADIVQEFSSVLKEYNLEDKEIIQQNIKTAKTEGKITNEYLTSWLEHMREQLNEVNTQENE